MLVSEIPNTSAYMRHLYYHSYSIEFEQYREVYSFIIFLQGWMMDGFCQIFKQGVTTHCNNKICQHSENVKSTSTLSTGSTLAAEKCYPAFKHAPHSCNKFCDTC